MHTGDLNAHADAIADGIGVQYDHAVGLDAEVDAPGLEDRFLAHPSAEQERVPSPGWSTFQHLLLGGTGHRGSERVRVQVLATLLDVDSHRYIASRRDQRKIVRMQDAECRGGCLLRRESRLAVRVRLEFKCLGLRTATTAQREPQYGVRGDVSHPIDIASKTPGFGSFMFAKHARVLSSFESAQACRGSP